MADYATILRQVRETAKASAEEEAKRCPIDYALLADDGKGGVRCPNWHFHDSPDYDEAELSPDIW